MVLFPVQPSVLPIMKKGGFKPTEDIIWDILRLKPKISKEFSKFFIKQTMTDQLIAANTNQTESKERTTCRIPTSQIVLWKLTKVTPTLIKMK